MGYVHHTHILAQFLGVLHHIHAALTSNTIITKRYVPVTYLSDIFYRDPGLFLSQRRVDSMIVRVCMTFLCTRASLNITAAPRSVVAGPVCFHTTKNEHGMRMSRGASSAEQLIPDPSMVHGVACRANWVLVVEKHAVFQTLCSQRFLDHVHQYGIAQPGIVMTGKGYPDHAARWLLGELVRTQQCGHIYFLVDADPHGVDIIRTYCEAFAHAPHAPCMHWLGLRTHQWMQRIPHLQLQHLTKADRRKALQLCHAQVPRMLRSEVAAQLHAGYKCELEVLCGTESGTDVDADLIRFVCTQMQTHTTTSCLNGA